MKRFSLTISDELCAKLNYYSEKCGCPRNSLIASWLGEKVMSLDIAEKVISEKLVREIVQNLVEAEIKKGENDGNKN